MTTSWGGGSQRPLPRHAADDTGPLAAIRRQFPRWRPFRSDAGRFWATRTGVRQPPLGGAMTVDGDTPSQLARAIGEQEELDSG